MMEHIYIAVLLISFYLFKIALVDRKAELLLFPLCMALFFMVGFSSQNIQLVVDGSLEFTRSNPLMYLGFFLGLLNLGLTVLSWLDKLPEPERKKQYKSDKL